ncbi:uncharacterized protein LOC142098417 [Mixophyes fleayi]|uniref:uncharacterized protein LOC142098417 n=1 Tax=Mixophyes fleayi TaxID=3061075 RepID=UPI003F4DC453
MRYNWERWMLQSERETSDDHNRRNTKSTRSQSPGTMEDNKVNVLKRESAQGSADNDSASEDSTSGMPLIPPENWTVKTLVENTYRPCYALFCIFTQSTDKCLVIIKKSNTCGWIEDLLQSNNFSEFEAYEEISTSGIHGDSTLKCKVSPSFCAIFCFENNMWEPALLEEVKILSSFYDMKNVIVLLGGGSSDHSLSDQNMTMTSWCKEQKYKCSFEILHLTDSEITWYRDHLKSYEKKMEGIRKLLEDSSYNTRIWIVGPTKHTVGIITRSSENDYEWLNSRLQSGSFQAIVQNVRPCYISNNRSQQFRDEVSQCTFGILYHTKNRGRINITDVTDSLYDEELQYMSEELGKSKVIVVVDDLENSSDKEKNRILELHPSIKANAQDMFMFTSDEKTFSKKLVNIKKMMIRDPAQQE